MGDEEPKYLNSPETVLFHKGQQLYGLYEARQALRSIDKLVVVEGYMDVVGLARHGIDFATATLGTATTDEHLNRLFRMCDEVLFSFDGDRAGRDAAWKALENSLRQMREGRQVRFVFLPDGQDPDSYVQENGADAFIQALDNALPLSDFLIEELSAQVDMESVDGRARMVELARPLLRSIPPGIYLELLIKRLAEIVGLPSHELKSILSQGAGTDKGKPSPKATAFRPRPATDSGQPSIVRRAITLIIQHPEAAANIDIEKLAGISKPGADLLHDLIEIIQSDPDMTTAGMLERFRNHADGQHLGKLAAMEMPESDDFDATAELTDCVIQLAHAAQRERINSLIEKQRLGSLSAPEKDELRELTRRSGTGG